MSTTSSNSDTKTTDFESSESLFAISSTSKSNLLKVDVKENKVKETVDTSLKGNDSGSQKSNENEETKKSTLTMAQRAQIELNRQKALLIRQEKINKRKLYEKVVEKPEKHKVIRINDSKLVDTGGGFFIEEKPNELTEEDLDAAMRIVTDPPPLLKDEQPFCEECSQPFDNSYLFHNFKEAVCDECRDRDDKHSLITKTDAKNNYLLNDVDFDKRETPLKFILRKNPHNSRWGEMKLYLKLQVEKRALEVWGSEEAIEEALEKREDKREVLKQKKYMKKMKGTKLMDNLLERRFVSMKKLKDLDLFKELRMNVRSSLYTRIAKTHEHEYGEEVYHSDDDEYSRTCTSCGHSYTYDKM